MAGIRKTNPRGIVALADGGSVPDAGLQMRQSALNQAADRMYWDTLGENEPPPQGFVSSLGAMLNGINPVAITKNWIYHMNHPVETAAYPGGGFEDVPGVTSAVKGIDQASSGNLRGAAGTALGAGIDAAVLAGVPYAAHRIYINHTPGGYEFYSPNKTEQVLNVDQAIAAMDSPEQYHLMQYGKDIDKSLGHKSVPVNALGVWKDGVENSILNKVYGRPSIDDLEYAAAKKGDHADQKSVGAFAFNQNGPDRLYRVSIPGISLKQAQMLADDSGMLATAEPTKDGANVIFVDEGDRLSGNVRQFAETNNGKVGQAKGYARFPGAETREDAHRVFGQIFSKYENR